MGNQFSVMLDYLADKSKNIKRFGIYRPVLARVIIDSGGSLWYSVVEWMRRYQAQRCGQIIITRLGSLPDN